MIRVLTLSQFAAETGGTVDGDVDAHIHAALRARPQTKTFKRFYDRTLIALQAKRDATKAAYMAAIVDGSIRAPTADERLQRIAGGHSDNPSVQAARRILAKRALRATTEQQIILTDIADCGAGEASADNTDGVTNV